MVELRAWRLVANCVRGELCSLGSNERHKVGLRRLELLGAAQNRRSVAN